MPEQFHFLQPLWFLALLPMALLLWWLPRAGTAGSDWQQACERHLLPYLLDKPVQALSHLPLWLLAAGWLMAVVALADPVWQKQPQPVYRSQDAVVVVLDLSRSMLSSDLTPSRLERARFKVAEILKQRKEGQTGLVVYAGDAFTVSPLTNDARTIQSLLAPLNPNLMPVQGGRADLGILQAGELLKQAGLNRGDILLIADDYTDPHTQDAAADLLHQGYRLSVLGVGSDRPAPIPDQQGNFVRDSQGQVVMPALDVAKLRQLASAGGGRYTTITVNDADLAQVLPASSQALDSRPQGTEQATDLWRSEGPWLVLALLPLAALAFRRGWLMVLPLLIAVTLGNLPQPAMASGWDDLWLRHDQQADQALKAGDAERARQLAEQPLRRGEAAYRAGDYADALKSFAASDTAQGDYNRGNALAQLGRYQDAIDAYDEALAKNPTLADASHNRQELEKLLKQQQQQQQQQQADKQNSGDNQDQDKQQQAGDPSGGDDQDKQQQAGNPSGGDNQDQDNQQQDEAQAQSERQDGAEGQSAQARETEQAQQQQTGSPAAAEPLNTADAEQQQADERWLRRIPDDPGGLLRRKFLYQYSQRGTQQDPAQQDW
ncbi:MAG: VWA domain-containing protein [Gammaproteobacteria bacterium]